MRSFFRRPSWASRGEETTTPDFYRRSGQTFADIIAANKEARVNSSTCDGTCDGDTPVEDGEVYPCRRKSNETQIKGCRPNDPTNGSRHPDNVDNSDESSRPRMEYQAVDDQYRNENQRAGSRKPELAFQGNVGSSLVTPSEIGSPRDNSPLENEVRTSNHIMQGTSKESKKFPDTVHPEATQTSSAEPGSSTDSCLEPKQNDQVVQILITSELENTKPLIVHRKMSQALKDVRLTWCRRQNLSDEVQSSVFLTWKGRRLFDVTTCRSLGIDSRTTFADIEHFDDHLQVEDESLRIHMEAVTEELFHSAKNRNYRHSTYATAAEVDSEYTETENKKNPSMKVVMKSPGLIDFKTKASPTTQISHLITAYRDAQSLPEGKHVYLLFDGDRLDPSVCLADYEIEDLDVLDVLIK